MTFEQDPASARPEPPRGPAGGDDLAFPAVRSEEVPPPPPRDRRGAIAVAGVVLALLAGGVAAVALRPGHGASASADGEAPDPADGDQRVQIELSKRPAPAKPLPTGTGKIDAAGTVIEPSAGSAAPAASAAASDAAASDESGGGGGLLHALGRLLHGDRDQASPSQSWSAPVQEAQAAPPAPQRQDSAEYDRGGPEWGDGERTDAPVAAPVRRTFSPSFDCRTAHSRGQQIVCEDAGLAAEDRRMARAFRDAQAAGASYEELSDQQRRWYAARDSAVSSDGLRLLYDQRIRELQAYGQEPD